MINSGSLTDDLEYLIKLQLPTGMGGGYIYTNLAFIQQWYRKTNTASDSAIYCLDVQDYFKPENDA